MILAINFHLRRGETQSIFINLVFLIPTGFVAYGRWFCCPHSSLAEAGLNQKGRGQTREDVPAARRFRWLAPPPL
jgi:hypothetical protein